MALLNVGDVVQGVATLLDDPGQTGIDQDYVIPFINLRWSNIIVNMAMLGLQYSEQKAIFDIPAFTTDLNSVMIAGGALASLMEPVSIEWKPFGADDTQYADAFAVRKLDDFPQGQQGIQQYAWRGGSVFLSPSGIAVTLRVFYKAMSTRLVDPTDTMIRGIGDIIAYRTAELICSVRGGMGQLKADLKTLGDAALDDFCAMGVMRDQTNLYTLPATHRRHMGGRMTITGR